MNNDTVSFRYEVCLDKLHAKKDMYTLSLFLTFPTSTFVSKKKKKQTNLWLHFYSPLFGSSVMKIVNPD